MHKIQKTCGKTCGTQPFSILFFVGIHWILKGLKTVSLKYLMWMCHIRYSVLTDFIYITLHAQDPKNMWKDKWNKAIFLMVLGKNWLNSKGIKKVTLKYLMWICHIRYPVLTDFIYITLHTWKPKTIWNTAIFHMVWANNHLCHTKSKTHQPNLFLNIKCCWWFPYLITKFNWYAHVPMHLLPILFHFSFGDSM